MHCGWSSGSEPRPEALVITPAPMRSANCWSWPAAPAEMTPPPAQTRGRRACRSRSAARATDDASGATGAGRAIGGTGPGTSMARYCWSIGISTETGPGRPDSASSDGCSQRRLDVLGARRPKRRFAHGPKHGELVLHVVEKALVLVDIGRLHLAGDVQHRRGRRERLQQGRARVGRAARGTGEHRGESASGAGVAVGHGGRAVLGPRGHDAHAAFTADGVEDRNVVHADDAEDAVDARGLQTIENELPTRAHAR